MVSADSTNADDAIMMIRSLFTLFLLFLLIAPYPSFI